MKSTFVLVILGSAVLASCSTTSKESITLYEAMTDQDIELAARQLQRTLDYAPDGTTRRWANDQSGHSGAITPVRSYVDPRGNYCRDYEEDIDVGAGEGTFFYSACREEDYWDEL